MTKQRLFSTGDASRLLKLTRATLDAWLNEYVEPTLRGSERGRQHVLDECCLFSLCMGRACRQRGMTLGQAGAVMKFVGNVGLEKLKAEFAAKRRFLVVVGNQTADTLLTREDAIGPLSPDVRRMIGDCVPVINVDLCEGFRAFENEVAQLVADRESKRAAARA